MAIFSLNRGDGLSRNAAQNVFDYLRPFLHLLITPAGIVTLIAALVIAAYGLQGRRGKELLLGVAMLTGMVGYFISPYWNNTLIPPLQAFRSMCKPTFVAAIVVLAIRYLTSQGTLRHRPVRTAAMAYIFLVLAFCLRDMFAAPERALGGFVVVLLLFFGVLEFIRGAVSTGEDLVAILSAAVTGGLAFYALSSVQLIFGIQGRIVFSGRFCGLSSNPQNAAEMTASLIVMANYLAISGFSSRWQKLIGAAGLVVMLPFLFWTGSRTGLGMAAVGLVVLNGVRVRRWVVFGAAVVLARIFYSHFFGSSSLLTSHVFSLQNDRIIPWTRGWELFVSHPLFGVGGAEFLLENSFLSVAMNLGIVGVGILAVLAYSQAEDIVFVLKNKGRLAPEPRKICDFVLALSMAFISGMFFDAYLLAVATSEALIAAMVLALTSVACDLVAAGVAAVPTGEEIERSLIGQT